jgi:hypothetical protein
MMRQRQRLRPRADLFRFLRRTVPKAMIDGRHGEAPVAAGEIVRREQHQRDRIGAAGNCEQKRRIRDE